MKRFTVMLMILALLCGCTIKPQKNEYQKMYAVSNDPARYHIALTSKIRYIYDDSMMTTNSESEILLDKETEYVDLKIKIYQRYDVIEDWYHLENGILTTLHGRSEGTMADLEPLIATIRLILPEMEQVKSFSVTEEDGGYRFEILALDEFWDTVSDLHSGDIVEEFDCELEETVLQIHTDSQYKVISEYIEYSLLIKDVNPYHMHVWLTLSVLPYEQ
ncbi:MAG: hypothetical protein IJM15_06285 [Erysipelotrichaceae bacterium]|nr:hypothetical protein [Erysipelotrichaceae bacterium]